MNALRLEDLISVEMLQKVQDNFSAAVGIAMIIVDQRGAPVTRPSNFSAFCQTIRTSAARRDQCFHCDDDGGRRAMAMGEPSIYQCHCGLVDFAAPIIVRDQYLGAVISGQVRLRDAQAVTLEYIAPPDDSWRQDDHLFALREKIDEIPYVKLRSAAYTLYHLAAYLVEESYSNAVSQELSAKNLKLMEESKRRVELEKSLREAELQALSYQVNPHFLFNVLNTIGRLALKEHAPKTEDMLYAFADMMRYVLKKSRSQIVSLQTEVGHVRNYLHIQKVRMGDRFTFTMDVPAKYDGILCPFMVLHPIVENSINYAIEPHEADGRIEITARDDGLNMILRVVDNGDGVSPELVRAALDGVAEPHGRTSIGLHNVDSRLRHFFGPDYGLTVESPATPGGGTVVEMRFPLEFDPCGT
ncbi:sensor histidine kinase [Rhodospirillum rubrum]|uniref:sensor histidine kinase n=1 Tax=Rhodospirillum rubrum TaxID=1085 RepID=UPI001F5B91B3|nr:PocR ligand-binding domain-containing protein [Rhodospirillum rubrum]